MAHRIRNFEALATNDERLDALAIAEAGYAAIDTGAALERTLRIEQDELNIGDTTYSLTGKNVFFVGVGKCAFAAARAVEKLLGDSLTGGIALDVSLLEGAPLAKIKTYTGTHPLPSDVNETATKHILEFLSSRTADDLVIMLISGGGSTLLCLHEVPMTCTDESVLFTELTTRGASIQDINTVRKHISRARGGGLAASAYPAEVISLIVSDVPGNDIEYIASGPTVLDSSSVADARAVLAKYNIPTLANIELIETPKEEKYFKRVTNIIFLTNQDALKSMEKEAVVRGYKTEIVNDRFIGEARDVGRAIVERLHGAQAKTALLYAGESTVTLGSTHGAGGRNQEMALAALSSIGEDELILPFASDGHDNTDYAGAIGDGITCAHALTQNLSAGAYLDGHRSYDFFKVTGDALVTGYTGSNVSDFIVALKK
jgi:glycerate-2-kinase